MQMEYKNEIEEFDSNGVLIQRNLVSLGLIQECLNTLSQFNTYERAIRDGNIIFDEDDKGNKYLKYFQHINFYVPIFSKLIYSKIIKIISTLLKQEVQFYSLSLHDKAPNVGTVTPLHQDNYYWCLSPPDALTAYIPLENQSPSNGGITYYPKTHHLGTLIHDRSKTKAFSSYINDFDGSKWESFNPTLNPGDVVFHHGNIIHGAQPNQSTQHRRALALIFFGEKARVSQDMINTYSNNLIYNRDGKISENVTARIGYES